MRNTGLEETQAGIKIAGKEKKQSEVADKTERLHFHFHPLQDSCLENPRYRGAGGLWLPFPPPGDLPHSGIKPASPVSAGGFFTTEPTGKP